MDTLATNIRQKIENVAERIQHAAKEAGRNPASVRLVIVTKAQPVSVVRAVIEAGGQILGENYPEETAPKIQALGKPSEVAWHMIGHLQSRKAPLVVDYFDLLESLDSLRLAEKLERQLEERERILPVLMEVNVSGEESKYGFQGWNESAWDDLAQETEKILTLPHINLLGLMTMPPLFADPKQVRPFFDRLRRLAEYLGMRFGSDHFSELSMGTSADFEIAVQEGATFVRVGTAIVGPRPRISR